MAETSLRTPIYEIKAEMFRALGHPVRIRTLELLVEGDADVSALVSDIGVDVSHLSGHLAVLDRAGVVTRTRSGSTVTYSLADQSVAQMLAVAKAFLLHSLGRSGPALDDATVHDDGM